MKIICVGRNYAKHARELNNPVPSQPIIFLKPETALIPKGHPFFYPNFTKDLHHEVELVVRINRVGKHIAAEYAHKYYDEIGIGVDFTARDVQQECKEKGHPWERAKAFDHSAPVGKKFVAVSQLPNPEAIRFRLEKNGQTVQEGNSADMIFSIPQLIEDVSKFMTLKIGDLIFTGTPEGVGPVQVGDKLEAFLEDQSLLKFDIR
ncbi:MAG: FAA hydrolase family protein [Cryomorphaceae bacterium]|nr:MAG: FAA hydrolase family protein [Cryomorphaceae bacterium]